MKEPLTTYKHMTEDADENKGTKAPRQRPQGGNDTIKRRHHRDHKVLGFHREPYCGESSRNDALKRVMTRACIAVVGAKALGFRQKNPPRTDTLEDTPRAELPTHDLSGAVTANTRRSQRPLLATHMVQRDGPSPLKHS
jgi:hypothetical protein